MKSKLAMKDNFLRLLRSRDARSLYQFIPWELWKIMEKAHIN